MADQTVSGLGYPDENDDVKDYPPVAQDAMQKLDGRTFVPCTDVTDRDAKAAAALALGAVAFFALRLNASTGQELEYTLDGTTWRRISTTTV